MHVAVTEGTDSHMKHTKYSDVGWMRHEKLSNTLRGFGHNGIDGKTD